MYTQSGVEIYTMESHVFFLPFPHFVFFTVFFLHQNSAAALLIIGVCSKETCTGHSFSILISITPLSTYTKSHRSCHSWSVRFSLIRLGAGMSRVCINFFSSLVYVCVCFQAVRSSTRTCTRTHNALSPPSCFTYIHTRCKGTLNIRYDTFSWLRKLHYARSNNARTKNK